ncbi:MAG: selenocysteine-specific translation elongation factor [Deltaproteobacteria bacterium]|nr:selenocysteine-specific translation elongation factor [Deltaproteobacteria bacterium]
MKHLVVGTAGHVDHGKTALVKVLTGVDTDRLEEEKQRGLTIQPGFAPLCLPSGRTVAFIDVPGHERFIKNMLRGVCGVDLAMLVVAADDGVMPQTREHLDILKLLGIRSGFVVLSKIDLVDKELAEMGREEIAELASGSFLEGAPCICFSAKTLEGRARIVSALEALYQTCPSKDPQGPTCLPIDRVFHVQGHGTVATGTLTSGKIVQEQTIEIYPVGLRDRVRHVQVHGKSVHEACAGERVALNLPQVSRQQIVAGMVIGEPACLRSSHLLNTSFHYLSSQKRPLKNRTRVRFYTSASETNALMVFMDRDMLRPGETAFVQFRLLDRLTPLAFDRFVVRSLSPPATIGGGMILEVDTRKYRGRDKTKIRDLSLLKNGALEEIIEHAVRKEGSAPVVVQDLQRALRIDSDQLNQILKRLKAEGKIINLPDRCVYHRKNFDSLKARAVEVIRRFHKDNPMEQGVSKADLRSSHFKSLDERLYDYMIEYLFNEGVISMRNGIIFFNGFKAHLNAFQETIRSKIIAFSTHSRVSLFTFDRMLKGIGVTDGKAVWEVVSFMKRGGELILIRNPRLDKRHQMQKGMYISKSKLQQIQKAIKNLILERGHITIHDLKALTGLNSNKSGALLDYLDGIHFTLPVGDTRVLRAGS